MAHSLTLVKIFHKTCEVDSMKSIRLDI